MEKLKIDDFKGEIDKGKLDDVFDIIFNKTIELVKIIAKKKGLDIGNLRIYDNKEAVIYHLEKTFEENSASFQSVTSIMRSFTRWDISQEDDFGTSKEMKIQMYIRGYNYILQELEEYEKTENKISKYGYENLKKEKIDKLIHLFKEMLEYKNKKYDETWSLEELINTVDKYYNFYHEELMNLLNQISSNTMTRYIYSDYMVCIRTNKVENIIALDYIYEILSSDNDGYKQFANFYKDVELEEGQTYKDVYNKKIENFVQLFKEMLEFLNIKYEDKLDNKNIDKDYMNLKSLIMKYYPYYLDNLIHLDVSMSSVNETYISLLDHMDLVYNYLNSTYKNHDENMKKYEKEQE